MRATGGKGVAPASQAGALVMALGRKTSNRGTTPCAAAGAATARNGGGDGLRLGATGLLLLERLLGLLGLAGGEWRRATGGYLLYLHGLGGRYS